MKSIEMLTLPQRYSDGSLLESKIVRSLFGKAKNGGIERFDLVAPIYYQNRGGLGFPPPPKADSSSIGPSCSGSSRRPDTSWERVFSEVAMKDLDVSTSPRKVVVNATLPVQIMSV